MRPIVYECHGPGKIIEKDSLEFGFTHGLSNFVKSEISRDVWIRTNYDSVRSIEWHFFVSQITGKGGPSDPLLQALHDAGIKVVFH